MKTVHTHDIIAYQRCKRQFFLGSTRFGLGYTSNAFHSFRELGTLFHATACYHYGDERVPWEDAIALAERDYTREQFCVEGTVQYNSQDHQEYLGVITLLKAMCAGYELWQAHRQDYYGDHNLEYQSGFGELAWTISGGPNALSSSRFGGKIDHLAFHKPTKEYWIIEHKTTGYPRDLIVGLSQSWQPRIYAWAMRKLYPDLNIVGVLYNVVTSTDPWEIKMLQTGYPSKAKAELDKTSHDIYARLLRDCALASCEDVELVLRLYKEQLDYLKGREYPLYFRHPLRIWSDDVTERQIEEIALDLEWDAEVFDSNQRDPAFVIPNLTGHVSSRYGGSCLGCPFVGPCQLMDQGQPWERLLQYHFTQEQEEDD